jgi:hypothetical protein
MRSRALVAALACLAPATAAAGPWRAQVEGGLEIDSNVQRVETGPELDNEAIVAPLVRAGGRVERTGRRGAGGYALGLSLLTRRSLSDNVTSENTATLGADARWLHGVGDGASAGVRAVYLDAIPTAGVDGTRTFRSLGGEAQLVLRRAEGDVVTLAAGFRDLAYKPDHDFDWRGPTAAVRLDRTLWRTADDTRTVELAAEYRLDRRDYEGAAFANRCGPTDPPTPSCSAPTDHGRIDLHHAAAIEATYTGERVASATYQLIAVDSNSYGHSLVRHRVILSATSELPAGFVGTATLTGQLDQFLDRVVVARDVTSLSFTALDDDNRSSLQLRAAHPIGKGAAAFEARAAYWTDLSSPSGFQYRRTLVYVGLVWSKD